MPLSSDHAMTAQPPAPAAAAAGNFLNLPPPPLSPDPQEMVEPFIKPPPGFTSGHTSPVLELPVSFLVFNAFTHPCTLQIGVLHAPTALLI